MDMRKMYNDLCNHTRRDPNAALLVNGHKYDILIDTIGLDSRYDMPADIEVRCKIRNVPYFCRTYASNVPTVNGSKIEKVIFNGPATIVLWSDGTKTVVKCQKDDMCDYEKGLAMAITKKALGNQGNYCNELKKWTQPAPPSYKSAMDEAMEENRRCAYNRLLNALHDKKATKVDLIHAMRDAARYLEYTLED